MTLVDAPVFGAWSLLSLTTTAHGAPIYPDELGVRYVYDTTVPNGRYIVPGDLAVVRDNRIVFGAEWIDSIEAAPCRKIRYRCPNCTSTDFKHRSRRQFAYRCAGCTAEFDVPVEEELTVQVFTANYSRTWRPADRPFPEKALDSAYVAKAQQHAIRRLDVTQLRPVLQAHLVTGEPNGLALNDHVRAEQVELDFPGDVGDAGLAGLAGGEVAGFLGLAGAGPVRAVADEGGGGEDLQQERGEREIGVLRGGKPRRCLSRRPAHAGS